MSLLVKVELASIIFLLVFLGSFFALGSNSWVVLVYDPYLPSITNIQPSGTLYPVEPFKFKCTAFDRETGVVKVWVEVYLDTSLIASYILYDGGPKDYATYESNLIDPTQWKNWNYNIKFKVKWKARDAAGNTRLKESYLIWAESPDGYFTLNGIKAGPKDIVYVNRLPITFKCIITRSPKYVVEVYLDVYRLEDGKITLLYKQTLTKISESEYKTEIRSLEPGTYIIEGVIKDTAGNRMLRLSLMADFESKILPHKFSYTSTLILASFIILMILTIDLARRLMTT